MLEFDDGAVRAEAGDGDARMPDRRASRSHDSAAERDRRRAQRHVAQIDEQSADAGHLPRKLDRRCAAVIEATDAVRDKFDAAQRMRRQLAHRKAERTRAVCPVRWRPEEVLRRERTWTEALVGQVVLGDDREVAQGGAAFVHSAANERDRANR